MQLLQRLIVLATCSLGLAAGLRAAPLQASQVEQLQVRFIDPSGAPLPGLRIACLGEQEHIRTTSRDGIVELPAGEDFGFDAEGFERAGLGSTTALRDSVDGAASVVLRPEGRMLRFDLGDRDASQLELAGRILLDESTWRPALDLAVTEPNPLYELMVSAREPLAYLAPDIQLGHGRWWARGSFSGSQIYLPIPEHLDDFVRGVPADVETALFETSPVLFTLVSERTLEVVPLEQLPGVGEVLAVDLTRGWVETRYDIADLLPPSIDEAVLEFGVRTVGRLRFDVVDVRLPAHGAFVLRRPGALELETTAKLLGGRYGATLIHAHTTAEVMVPTGEDSITLQSKVPQVSLEALGSRRESLTLSGALDVAVRRHAPAAGLPPHQSVATFDVARAMVDMDWVTTRGPIMIQGAATGGQVWIVSAPEIVGLGPRRAGLLLPPEPVGTDVVIALDVPEHRECIFDGYRGSKSHLGRSVNSQNLNSAPRLVPTLIPAGQAHDSSSAPGRIVQVEWATMTVLGVPQGRYDLAWFWEGDFVDWIARDVEVRGERVEVSDFAPPPTPFAGVVEWGGLPVTGSVGPGLRQSRIACLEFGGQRVAVSSTGDFGGALRAASTKLSDVRAVFEDGSVRAGSLVIIGWRESRYVFRFQPD